MSVLHTQSGNRLTLTDNLATPTAAEGIVTMGQYNSSLPTYTSGDVGFLQLTSEGRLMTDTSITVETIDVQLGAVEIKNAADNTRAVVRDDGTENALVVTTNVMEITSALPTGTNTIGAVGINDGSESLNIVRDDQPFSAGMTGTLLMGAATSATIGSGDIGALRLTTDRYLQVQGPYQEDTAHTSGDLGHLILAVRNDTLASLVGTDGDYAPLQVDANGALYVQHSTLSVVGGGTEATAMRVTIANDSTGLLSVDDNAGSLTIDNSTLSVVGGGTEATALRVTIANDSTGVLSIDDNSTTISIDDGAGAITVDWAGTAPPIGAGLEATALRVTVATDSTGVLSIDDNAGALTVDNAGTFAVQVDGSALTALQLIDNPVAVLGTATYTEATSSGFIIGAVRNDTLATLAGTDNEIAPLQVDANGALYVTAASPANQTASGALGALNDAVTVDAEGTGTINWEIDTGTLVGTVVFEATLDDTNYFAIDAIQIDGTIITSIASFAARGAITSTGYSQVRLRVSAWTSGTSNARVEASSGTNVVRIGDSLPTGSNAIGKLAANTGIDIGDVDVTSVPAPLNVVGGGTEATALRVTLASDSTGLVSIDDNAGSITVDGTFWQATQPISGTVTANLSAVDNAVLDQIELNTDPLLVVGTGTEATAQRVTIATDSTGVLSIDDNAGSITVDGTFWQATQPISGSLTTVSTVTTVSTLTGGAVAHDAADSGNPVKIGGRVERTAVTEMADGDRTDAIFDQFGLQQIVFGARLTYTSIDKTTTAAQAIVAAPAAGHHLRIYGYTISNEGTEQTTATITSVASFNTKDGSSINYVIPGYIDLATATACNATLSAVSTNGVVVGVYYRDLLD